MDTIKISELPALSTTPGAADIIPIVHSGQTEQTVPSALATDWKALALTVNTVTYNGNGSYDLGVSADVSGIASNGMKMRSTRTVAAPTRCTSLNGTTQYYSRASGSLGTTMTWTDDFAGGAWIKMTAYVSSGVETIISRFNATSGWAFFIEATGQVTLSGYNASGANYRRITSYQSVSLNRWIHVAAQEDMSANTPTTTTCYVMINGVDVPAFVTSSGTNPTALIQAGNLEAGSFNGGSNPFSGKMAQVFVTSAKITQANVKTLYSQGLTAALISANNVVSAYSFDNSIADLNTTSANNLTANGSAVATNADSPFGMQSNGVISDSLDYMIMHSVTSSTITVQVPEGCTVPTSGGVSALAYATVDVPYGFPTFQGRWRIETVISSTEAVGIGAINQWFIAKNSITVPVGAWKVGYEGPLQLTSSGSGVRHGSFLLYSGTPVNNARNYKLASWLYVGTGLDAAGTIHRETHDLLLTATLYNFYGQIYSSSGSETYQIAGGFGLVCFFAENDYL